MRLFRLALFATLVFVTPATAQESAAVREMRSLPWQTHPAVGKIDSVAQIKLSGGLRFLDSASTSRFLELQGNPPRSGHYALLPKTDHEWFSIFDFERSGYVRDDEALDPDELLKSLKQGNVAGVAERKKLNLPILILEGWAVPPHYDSETHLLEWATRLRNEDTSEVYVNYTIRLLGRSGVMSAVIVTEPEMLSQDVRDFKAALRGFDFVPGEQYREYRQGDKVAAYGLGGLVLGGAAVAVAKSGLLKSLGKFAVIGAIAAFAAVVALIKRIFR